MNPPVGSIKVLVLCVCLAAAGLLIQLHPPSEIVEENDTLHNAISDIGMWKHSHDIFLDKAVVSTLKLDDYFNAVFTDKGHLVSLYIGYYYTAKKVGAAHDPLVCFPGQGWKVSGRHQGKVKIKALPDTTLSYAVMTVQQASRKDLILYWFQAHDKSSAGTLDQKLNLLWKRISGKGEHNAFVRITVPLEKRTSGEAEIIALNFAREFYPVFQNFIVN